MCVRARVSERERERVNARKREESVEKGGGLCSETQTNDHEQQITHISTQSQRYRKEVQRIGTAVHACTAVNKDMTRLNAETPEVLLKGEVQLLQSGVKDSNGRFEPMPKIH